MRADKLFAYENVMTAVLGATFGIVFFDRNSLNFLMPFVLKDIPLTNTEIGLLASGLSLSWAISGFCVGLLSDRLGRRKPLLISAVILFSVSSFLTGLGRSFLVLLATRLLMGLAEGPVLPISQSLMAEASSPERRGLNMGLMQNVLSNLVGSLVTPLAVVALATAFGWRSAFYVTALPGLFAAAMIAVFVKETPRQITRQSHADHVPLGLAEVFACRNMLLCIAISSLMVGWMVVGWVFLPVYFTSLSGFSPTEMSLLMSALGISGALAGFLVPALSDRFGRRSVLVGGCLLGVLTPIAALTSAGSVAALTFFVAFGWMAGGTFSIFMATVPSESSPPNLTATAMAMSMGAGELFGGAIAPAVVGRIADQSGLVAAPAAQLVLAGASALLSLWIVETAPLRTRVAMDQQSTTAA